VLALAVLALAGCGKSESEQQKEADRGPLTCEGSQMTGSPRLPAGFPSVGNITYVDSSKEGPTTVVEGFSTTGLKNMHDGYVDDFKSAGYVVLFEELEDHDSEVSYKTKDATRTGQVALRECDNGTTSVHITVRPS
jgi:hypothetical protein